MSDKQKREQFRRNLEGWILMEGTCCNSDGSMCENYPWVLCRAKNT